MISAAEKEGGCGCSRADKELSARLSRIEGQVRGLQRMIDEKRSCQEVVTQLLAVRSAFDQACASFMQRSLERCLRQSLQDGVGPEETLVATEALIRNFARLM